MDLKLHNPIQRQREVLYLPHDGHSAVLGAAGSGKTTLALYRAAYLSNESMPHAGKTLLLTYNKTLVTYLKYIKPIELRNVQIDTYHTFVCKYLNKRGKLELNGLCLDESVREKCITSAVKEIGGKHKLDRLDSFFKRPREFFMEEVAWILSNGIKSKEEYVKVDRVGRADSRIIRSLRPVMYDILKCYRRIRIKEHHKRYDCDDIAIRAHLEFKEEDKANNSHRFKHIIIDEGQDFSPEIIRSLVAANQAGGSITFFGDVAQQIYGHRMSWRSAGLKIRKPWLFKENYRNSKQISNLGKAITKMEFFSDDEDMVETRSTRADGPLPALIECKTRTQQIEYIAKRAMTLADTQRVAIFAKKNDLNDIRKALGGEALRLDRSVDEWEDGPGICYSTYHSAKGLEFDVVFMPFLEDANMPGKDYMETYGAEESNKRYARLLYVGVTRAKSTLFLLYSGELTQLLPDDKSLYQKTKL